MPPSFVSVCGENNLKCPSLEEKQTFDKAFMVSLQQLSEKTVV